MKRTMDLLHEVIDLGFCEEYALKGIDESLDAEYGAENRKNLSQEEIPSALYREILGAFQIEKEENDFQRKEEKEKMEQEYKKQFCR